MLSKCRGRITCEQLWTDVNRCEQSFIAQRSQVQTANANRKQRRKLRQNQQQVITAAVSFGKQNPSTTSPQQVWRVLVSLHHAVKMERENHMWTIVNRCEQSFIAQRSQVQTANANRKQRRKLRQNGQQVITAAVSFGKQNQVQLRHNKSEGSLFLCIMLPDFRGRITCERLCTDVNSHLLHKDHKCKRQMQTENNGENYDRMDNKWSQQQSALVSRIKYNFATTSLKGPCFSASCCQIFEGELHVNACAQMWTVIYCTKITSANGKCKQKTTEKTTTEWTTSDHSSRQLW